MKRKLPLIIAIVTLLIFAGLAIHGISHNRQEIHRQNIQLESKDFKMQQLETKFQQLNKQYEKERQDNTLNEQKEQEYQNRIKQLEDDYKALELSKAQQKAEQQRLASVSLFPKASAASGCSTGNAAKDFIYMHESGCNPNAKNPGGCYGLGQDCNGIVEGRCGADYACQDTFFTDYMFRRYGSWEAAKAHWQARVPINGKDVGNWW